MTRVMVTGSRSWTDVNAIAWALGQAHQFAGGPYTLVHGAAGGADTIAASMAASHGLIAEPHPVNWRPYGIYNPQAGLIRNREMLESGIDLVLSFWDGKSTGTKHATDLAKQMGIEVWEYASPAAD